MGRWLRVLFGPLPATVLLLPLLFGGGAGAVIGLVTVIFDPGSSSDERWNSLASTGLVLGWVAAAGIGVLALWAVVLAESPAALRTGRIRWWLAAGLMIGLVAAVRFLWTMVAGGHAYELRTWALWLLLLLGPMVLGVSYLLLLLRR